VTILQVLFLKNTLADSLCTTPCTSTSQGYRVAVESLSLKSMANAPTIISPRTNRD